jgi:spore germination protein YaaH
MNGPSEIGESDPSTPQTPNADPGLTEIPVIDRIPRNTTGKKKSHKPPRPTRETPRTQLLLPQSRKEWVKIAGAVAGVVLVVAAALTGLRLLSDNGCNEFTAENQTVTAGPLKINILPGDLVGSFGVKTSVVPLAEFGPAAQAGEAQAAAAVIPQTLSPQSDFVAVRTCSVNPKLITLRMAAPAEVASLGSLDLYGWNAQTQAWNWIGGEVDEANREIIGYTHEMPSAIMLMKTAATPPSVGLEMPPMTPEARAGQMTFPASSVSSSGIYLADMGSLTGDRSRLVPANADGAKVVPAVRNWGENGEVNRTVLRNALESETSRASHINNLVQFVETAGYGGLEIDYRGVTNEQQQAFADFIEALSQRLTEKGKSLYVTVPAPVLNSDDTLSTPGYDLRRLGRLSTGIKLDLSTNPGMLMSAQLDKAIDWISGQVNRYNLQLVVPAASIQQDANHRTRLISMEEALAGLGRLVPSPSLVQPGASVQLKWQGDGKPVDVTYDPETKAYCYSYIDERGIKQTVWLNTAASLHHVLERLSQHNLRGVTLRGMMNAGNDEGVQQVVEGYLQGRLADVAPPDPQVKVAFGQGTPFSLPMSDAAMTVQAPGGEGAYDLRAQFASARAIDLDAMQVQVSKDAPAPIGGANAISTTAALSGTADPTALSAAPTPGVIAGVNAERFDLGGHVNDLSHVTQMQGAGMTWVRAEVADLSLPADFINEAKAKGMKVLVTAIGDRTRVMDEAYRAEWTQHLGKLAAAGVDAIEVWSGPNYEADWPTGNISGASYAALLKQAYAAIKQANPNTLVISGGLAQTGGAYSGGCDAQGCDEMAFLGQMAAAGAKDAMDCIGIHYTNGIEAPSAVGGNHYSMYFTPLWNAYYGAFNGAKPVCFTALGYVTAAGFADGMPANYSFAAGTTLQNHADWLAEAARLAKSSEKVRLAIVWNVDSTVWRGGDEGDPQAGYAMIRPDGTCPACETLSGAMASQ